MLHTSSELRERFARDGYVITRALLPREEVIALRVHAESLVTAAGTDRPGPYSMQKAFDADLAVKLIKASDLVKHDPLFYRIATDTRLVDVVEALLGSGARRFRDVLVVKPGGTGGAFSYHQDSAYWDVEPKSLVSCWLALGDVPEENSCLRVIPGSHTRLVEHGLYIRGRYEVPRPITRMLRRLVSFTGTGDNPGGTGGSRFAWKMKRWLLAETTKYVPALFDLQDFRVPPALVRSEQEQSLPVRAGDVIFFHSLLWHASGPNRSDTTRFAEIISFMGADARFVGRGAGHFPLARRA